MTHHQPTINAIPAKNFSRVFTEGEGGGRGERGEGRGVSRGEG